VKVCVVWATRAVQDLVPLELPEGATIADAVLRSGLVDAYGLDAGTLACAVHGKRRPASAPLVDGDRVEITRALVADPKEARRRRALKAPLPKTKPKQKRRDWR
jgi:putative ubiquitin-RnfH superfamily antitoxin RatB of RatAB toxin-antitoxin module